MQSAHLLERVDHRCRREGARRQPAARIRKQTGNSREHRADRGQAYDETGLLQFREGRLIRFGEFISRGIQFVGGPLEKRARGIGTHSEGPG